MEQLKCPPGLRIQDGEWHYRFEHQGREWTGTTGLKATKRNVNDALTALTTMPDGRCTRRSEGTS